MVNVKENINSLTLSPFSAIESTVAAITITKGGFITLDSLDQTTEVEF